MREKKIILPEQSYAKQVTPQTWTERQEVEQMIQFAKEDIIQHASEKIDIQIQKTQDSFIVIFGIFASVISFLTIEFQFLRIVLDIKQIIGLSLILFLY